MMVTAAAAVGAGRGGCDCFTLNLIFFFTV